MCTSPRSRPVNVLFSVDRWSRSMIRLGGHTIVESIENRDYVVNKISDELGEIIRILQLVTIDDVLLNEFDEDEQHSLKKLLVSEGKTLVTWLFGWFSRKHSGAVCFKRKRGCPMPKHWKGHWQNDHYGWFSMIYVYTSPNIVSTRSKGRC